MTKQITAAIVSLALLTASGAASSPALAQTDGCATVAPTKKRAFGGFGMLLGAAQRAGLTDMVAANLGDGAGAQIAGVVAGAAGAAGAGGDAGGMAQALLANAMGGASQGARAAQVAGAVTGMARELGGGQGGAAASQTAAPCRPAAAGPRHTPGALTPSAGASWE